MHQVNSREYLPFKSQPRTGHTREPDPTHNELKHTTTRKTDPNSELGCVSMVVRFVGVIRVPLCAHVSRVCPVCVPAPPGVFLPVPVLLTLSYRYCTDFFYTPFSMGAAESVHRSPSSSPAPSPQRPATAPAIPAAETTAATPASAPLEQRLIRAKMADISRSTATVREPAAAREEEDPWLPSKARHPMAAKKKPKGDCKKAPEDAVALLAECRLLASDEAAAKEPAVAAPATEEAPARPSRPSAAAAVPKRSSPTKRTRSHSPMRMGKASTIHPRACAIIYDDNMMNFAGIVPRGKAPKIRAVHCLQPLTVAQLEEALALHQEEQEALAMQQDSAEDPVPPPNLFFFFDFDDTLSLCSGIDLSVNANDCDATLARLFGDDARQAALVKLLSALLLQERIFVLTANRGYQMGAHLLNLLLGTRGASHVGGRHVHFVADQTVHFTPTGTKVRAVTRLLEARGFRLVAQF